MSAARIHSTFVLYARHLFIPDGAHLLSYNYIITLLILLNIIIYDYKICKLKVMIISSKGYQQHLLDK